VRRGGERARAEATTTTRLPTIAVVVAAWRATTTAAAEGRAALRAASVSGERRERAGEFVWWF
jgi:hypothetical protein